VENYIERRKTQPQYDQEVACRTAVTQNLKMTGSINNPQSLKDRNHQLITNMCGVELCIPACSLANLTGLHVNILYKQIQCCVCWA